MIVYYATYGENVEPQPGLVAVRMHQNLEDAIFMTIVLKIVSQPSEFISKHPISFYSCEIDENKIYSCTLQTNPIKVAYLPMGKYHTYKEAYDAVVMMIEHQKSPRLNKLDLIMDES